LLRISSPMTGLPMTGAAAQWRLGVFVVSTTTQVHLTGERSDNTRAIRPAVRRPRRRQRLGRPPALRARGGSDVCFLGPSRRFMLVLSFRVLPRAVIVRVEIAPRQAPDSPRSCFASRERDVRIQTRRGEQFPAEMTTQARTHPRNGRRRWLKMGKKQAV